MAKWKADIHVITRPHVPEDVGCRRAIPSSGVMRGFRMATMPTDQTSRGRHPDPHPVPYFSLVKALNLVKEVGRRLHAMRTRRPLQRPIERFGIPCIHFGRPFRGLRQSCHSLIISARQTTKRTPPLRQGKMHPDSVLYPCQIQRRCTLKGYLDWEVMRDCRRGDDLPSRTCRLRAETMLFNPMKDFRFLEAEI